MFLSSVLKWHCFWERWEIYSFPSLRCLWLELLGLGSHCDSSNLNKVFTIFLARRIERQATRCCILLLGDSLAPSRAGRIPTPHKPPSAPRSPLPPLVSFS